MTKRIYILFLTLLFTQLVFGQFIGKDAVSKALFYLQKNELDSAKKYIDEADLDQELIIQPKTWYYKALIYKDLYKLNEKDNKNSPLRLTAVESLKKLNEVDTQKEFSESAQKMMTYLASTYYNDAARSLNPQSYKNAEDYYAKYRELMLYSTTNVILLQQDVKFKLALASMLNQDLERQQKKDSLKVLEVLNLYNTVLSIDTTNGTAYYSIGIQHYNEAADLINNMDYDMDLEKLDAMQDICINLFLQSLPYMLKSYELEWNLKETLIGLINIYHGLNDSEKEEFYKNKLKALELEQENK